MNSQAKLRYVDRLKGLGILLMIAGHLYTFCYDETSTTANQMIRWTNMPMFLFLSGCVISTPPIGIRPPEGLHVTFCRLF